MSKRSRFSATAAALAALLALALLPAGAAAAERTVTVEATATIKLPNDSASIGLGVTLLRDSRGAALRAVSAKLKRVIGAVQAIPGVGPGDVQTGRVSVSKPRDRSGFRASESIGVTLHEPSRAGDLVQAAIGAGATGVRGPSYFVGDTEAAFSKALVAAFEKAKAKAAALASAAGATLGAALVINEGGKPEITPYEKAAAPEAPPCAPEMAAPSPPHATAKRPSAGCGSPPPPTKPGVSTVTATVGVVFALQ